MSEVHRVVVGRGARGKVGVVGGDTFTVSLGRLLVVADTLHDVGGHVLEVTGRRHHAGKALGCSECFLRVLRSLHGVDVVVIRPRVMRITAQDRLEACLNVRGPFGGLTIGRPQLPGVHVHLGFRTQRLHVGVLRKALRELAHRGGIGAGYGLEIFGTERLGLRITRCECGDQPLLDGRRVRGVLLSFAQCLGGDECARLLHRREVVVRADGQRHAPVTGGTARVELRRLCKGARRLVVIERPQEAHALVEVLLGLRRRGGHGTMEITEALEELRPARPVRNCCRQLRHGVRLGWGIRPSRAHRAQKKCQHPRHLSAHRVSPVAQSSC